MKLSPGFFLDILIIICYTDTEDIFDERGK